MNVLVRTQNVSLTPDIRNYLKRRLEFSLGKRSDSIHVVKVALSDINGPKGGQDKRCKLKVIISKLPPIFIKDTHESIYSAIDSACDRAARIVNRRLSMQKEKRRYEVSLQAV